MSVYLEDHPPARTQYRAVRRAQVTGAIVIHSAENTPDLDGGDGGAEGVARFISTRTDGPASYHSVVDSDSIVRVGRYEWEMFHEGTGGNRFSLGLSFACRAAQWPILPEVWRQGALRNAAIEAANMARWVKEARGIVVPARRITPAEYRKGVAGFISHAELDPTRRSDPGAGFPWTTFMDLYRQEMAMPSKPADDKGVNPYAAETAEALQLLAEHAGYQSSDRTWFGPLALDALHRLKNWAVRTETEATQAKALLEKARIEYVQLQQELTAVKASRDNIAVDLDRAIERADQVRRDLEAIKSAAVADLLATIKAEVEKGLG